MLQRGNNNWTSQLESDTWKAAVVPASSPGPEPQTQWHYRQAGERTNAFHYSFSILRQSSSLVLHLHKLNQSLYFFSFYLTTFQASGAIFNPSQKLLDSVVRGKAYILVKTTKNPNGELRGQIQTFPRGENLVPSVRHVSNWLYQLT